MLKIKDFLKLGLNIYKFFFGKIVFLSVLIIENKITFVQKLNRYHSKKNKSNIIILGGLTTNKGCQAMTFTTIDQFKRRFPDKKIYLIINSDFDKKINKEKFNFKILSMNGKMHYRLSSFLYRFLTGNPLYSKVERNIINILKNTEFIVDVYGFRLSSILNPSSTWISCILDIIIAKRYNTPFFIFPQSIGPFNFPLMQRLFFYNLAKSYLKYPEKIFVREYDGIRFIKEFRKDNIIKTYDIVLQNSEYNISNILKRTEVLINYHIKINSVCVVPDIKLIERFDSNKIYSIYYNLIKILISKKKNVYILTHSVKDLEISMKIKKLFKENNMVSLIHEDLNVFEIEDIIRKFDFLIASRYHSIVHAYKNGVPALVIGWAIKYIELLKSFNQIEYYFDIRDDLKIESVSEKLEKMMLTYKNEKLQISLILNKILKENNFFDLISN